MSSSTPRGWATIRGWEVRLPNQLLIRGDVMAILREAGRSPARVAGERDGAIVATRVQCLPDAGEASLPDGEPGAPAGINELGAPAFVCIAQWLNHHCQSYRYFQVSMTIPSATALSLSASAAR